MMPWVATGDFGRMLGMNRGERKALLRIASKFPDFAKRIRTENGAHTDVLAYGTARGFMASDRWDDDTRVVFRQRAFAAAERCSPLLFHRAKTGELLIHSKSLAMLLGMEHETIVRLRGTDPEAFAYWCRQSGIDLSKKYH
jgi:hypothetical protein